jgi:hypothetical protein
MIDKAVSPLDERERSSTWVGLMSNLELTVFLEDARKDWRCMHASMKVT